MKNARLLSTVAAMLLLAVGAASAQDVKKDEAPTRAPAAQQNAPAEKVVPAMKPGAQNAQGKKAPETTGQAPEGDRTKASDKGAVDKGAMDKKMDKGAAAKGSSDANGRATVKNKSSLSESGTAPSRSVDESKRGTTAQASVDEGAAGGPNRVSQRHYRHHYRHCWTNIFDNRRCWR